MILLNSTSRSGNILRDKMLRNTAAQRDNTRQDEAKRRDVMSLEPDEAAPLNETLRSGLTSSNKAKRQNLISPHSTRRSGKTLCHAIRQHRAAIPHAIRRNSTERRISAICHGAKLDFTKRRNSTALDSARRSGGEPLPRETLHNGPTVQDSTQQHRAALHNLT